jgi:hypothetical protein
MESTSRAIRSQGNPGPGMPRRAVGRLPRRLGQERPERHLAEESLAPRCGVLARTYSGRFSGFLGGVLRIHPMSQLRSLGPSPNIAVIGASGGIGRAFVESLAGDCPAGTVHALSRSPQRSAGNVHHQFIDITEEGSIRAAAEAASRAGPLDLVIVASGILHRDSELQPEKSMRASGRTRSSLPCTLEPSIPRSRSPSPRACPRSGSSRLRKRHGISLQWLTT